MKNLGVATGGKGWAVSPFFVAAVLLLLVFVAYSAGAQHRPAY